MRRRDMIGIGLAIGIVAAIVGAVPLFFLIYGGLGSAVFGLGAIAILIGIQYLLFWPIWKRVRAPSSERSANKELPDGN